MKRLLSALCASVLAFSVTATGLIPAEAAPVPARPTAVANENLPVVDVQSRGEYYRHLRRGGTVFNRGGGYERRNFRRGERNRYSRIGDRDGYYRGHRGYREYRRGYRRHGGFWYPAAAFLAGAAISGVIANQPREVYRGGGNSHTQWCYNRYRSYRASDNTFQPYNGPRQQCYSPYS